MSLSVNYRRGFQRCYLIVALLWLAFVSWAVLRESSADGDVLTDADVTPLEAYGRVETPPRLDVRDKAEAEVKAENKAKVNSQSDWQDVPNAKGDKWDQYIVKGALPAEVKAENRAKVKGLLVDPQFQKLDIASQRRTLSRVDHDFAALSDADFEQFKQRITTLLETANRRLWHEAKSIAVLGLAVPAAGYVFLFMIVPWIYRGFRQDAPNA